MSVLAIDGRNGGASPNVALQEPASWRRAVRRHAPIIVVLVGALALRICFIAAYRYGFFIPDSRGYVRTAAWGIPDVIRPYGYSVFLNLLPGGLSTVVVVQHVIGMGLVVVGYVFLLRRGVRPWLAALAAVPVALDARLVTLEHYVLAETLFLALTLAGLVMLARRGRLGVVAAAAGGLFLAGAALTRSVGLPLIGLAAIYLLVRRVGWRPFTGFVAAAALSIGGYAWWYHDAHGVYALGQFQGRFLYGRMMTIADCDRLRLEQWERGLCDPLPPDEAETPDVYIWNPQSPANRLYGTLEGDPTLTRFAMHVLQQRPGEFLVMVLRESSWHVVRPSMTPSPRCLIMKWLPPARPDFGCEAQYYRPTSIPDEAPTKLDEPDRPLPSALARYGTFGTTPGIGYAIAILVVLFAAVWRLRRPGRRDALDALLFVGSGVGLVVISVATSMYDSRYVLPAVVLVPIGTALAVHRILGIRRTVVTEAPASSTNPSPPVTESDR